MYCRCASPSYIQPHPCQYIYMYCTVNIRCNCSSVYNERFVSVDVCGFIHDLRWMVTLMCEPLTNYQGTYYWSSVSHHTTLQGIISILVQCWGSIIIIHKGKIRPRKLGTTHTATSGHITSTQEAISEEDTNMDVRYEHKHPLMKRVCVWLMPVTNYSILYYGETVHRKMVL